MTEATNEQNLLIKYVIRTYGALARHYNRAGGNFMKDDKRGYSKDLALHAIDAIMKRPIQSMLQELVDELNDAEAVNLIEALKGPDQRVESMVALMNGAESKHLGRALTEDEVKCLKRELYDIEWVTRRIDTVLRITCGFAILEEPFRDSKGPHDKHTNFVDRSFKSAYSIKGFEKNKHFKQD